MQRDAARVIRFGASHIGMRFTRTAGSMGEGSKLTSQLPLEAAVNSICFLLTAPYGIMPVVQKSVAATGDSMSQHGLGQQSVRLTCLAL